jgi:hypothetical protein
MFILKAFAEHAQLVSNTLGVVNAIGELSTRSLTFAREKGQYRAAATDPIRLVTFTSANDATPTTLSTAQSNHVLTIVDGLYDYMFAHPGENFSDTIHDYMLATFAASAEDFVVGPIVNDGTNYICEWIQWSAKSVTGWTATTLKVWLSDAAFQAQYDDFQIVVVPPITNLNDFFQVPHTGATGGGCGNAHHDHQSGANGQGRLPGDRAAHRAVRLDRSVRSRTHHRHTVERADLRRSGQQPRLNL